MRPSDEIQSQHLSSGKMFDSKPLRGSSNSRRSFCLPTNIFDERVNAPHPSCANLALAASSVTKRYSQRSHDLNGHLKKCSQDDTQLYVLYETEHRHVCHGVL